MSTTATLIVSVIVAIFASTGFWDWLKSRRKKMTRYEQVTMAMGRDRLNFLSKKHLREGYIPEDEFESFKELGEAYIDAGGNTMVKELYLDAIKLQKKWDV